MFKLTHYWYRKNIHPLLFFLLPFSWLFGFIVVIRRALYRVRLLKTHSFSVPVIVVGNITIGGTGKTPFVLWLAQFLRAQGYKPGIVSRGVGGKKHRQPYWVMPTDTAVTVGDEAILLQRSGCATVLCVDRAKAVSSLLSQSDCNIVISDDGLQHYRLGRDIEIALLDGVRQLGNQCLLPAGPLRELPKRLSEVDFVMVKGNDNPHGFGFTLESQYVVSLKTQQTFVLTDFPHKKIHAVAGIGHPEGFFQQLKAANFEVMSHAFPDHYLYQAQDICFRDTYPILMTEKDAVKCEAFADERCWYVKTDVKIADGFAEQLLKKIKYREAVC